MPTLEEMKDALGNCWTEEFGELELNIHQTLTEPTCPTAVISTEEETGPSWRADADTIDDAIRIAITAAYVTIIERKPKPLTVPWTDKSDGDPLARFLAALDAKK